MKTLHILNKSPQNPFPASQCARFNDREDSILLIEDAVYYTMQSNCQALLNDINYESSQLPVYALREDLEARGILPLIHESIQVVSYKDFVELTASHDKSTSWY